MKERPIIMSGSSVRAILAGAKTQTRRVMKLQPGSGSSPALGSERYRGCVVAFWGGESEFDGYECHCPQGAPGDRLWVKESWQAVRVRREPLSGVPLDVVEAVSAPTELSDREIYYRATYFGRDTDPLKRGWRWRSPLFMPRRFSRLTLEITDVRVERLRDISDAGAIAEGFEGELCDHLDPESMRIGCTDCMNSGWLAPPWVGFHLAWDELNAKRGFGWETNPWVWVVEFKRHEPGTER